MCIRQNLKENNIGLNGAIEDNMYHYLTWLFSEIVVHYCMVLFFLELMYVMLSAILSYQTDFKCEYNQFKQGC